MQRCVVSREERVSERATECWMMDANLKKKRGRRKEDEESGYSGWVSKWMVAISASHNKNIPLESPQRLIIIITTIIMNNVISNTLAGIWFSG